MDFFLNKETPLNTMANKKEKREREEQLAKVKQYALVNTAAEEFAKEPQLFL